MFKRGVYPGITLAAAVLIAGQALKSQAPAAPQWEFASVTPSREYGQSDPGGTMKWYDDAATCIATSQGCQARKITAEGTRNAMMQAAAILGEQGWELVSVTNIPNLPSQEGGPTMFFKRLKATPK